MVQWMRSRCRPKHWTGGRDVRLARNAIGCDVRGFNGKTYYSCPSGYGRIGACNAGAAFTHQAEERDPIFHVKRRRGRRCFLPDWNSRLASLWG
jgi:hypothetical protein